MTPVSAGKGSYLRLNSSIHSLRILASRGGTAEARREGRATMGMGGTLWMLLKRSQKKLKGMGFA